MGKVDDGVEEIETDGGEQQVSGMTVQELIDVLQTCPDKTVKVLLSSDAEGSDFHILQGADDLHNYDPDSREIGLAALTDELRKDGYTEMDCIKGVPVVVLWP
jgi:hypothetical protein